MQIITTAALPATESLRAWKLLYSTARDGASLSSLLWRCSHTPHTSVLIVIEDRQGMVYT
jgi:hypothetical protein